MGRIALLVREACKMITAHRLHRMVVRMWHTRLHVTLDKRSVVKNLSLKARPRSELLSTHHEPNGLCLVCGFLLIDAHYFSNLIFEICITIIRMRS